MSIGRGISRLRLINQARYLRVSLNINLYIAEICFPILFATSVKYLVIIVAAELMLCCYTKNNLKISPKNNPKIPSKNYPKNTPETKISP